MTFLLKTASVVTVSLFPPVLISNLQLCAWTDATTLLGNYFQKNPQQPSLPLRNLQAHTCDR